MAQITWRDVAAPDFSGAGRGFTDAGRLLQDTIGKAVGGVADFDKGQDAKAAQALALYVAQHPDSAALRDAVANGQVGDLDLANTHVARAIIDQLNPTKINGMEAAELARRNAARGEQDAIRNQKSAITAFDHRNAMDKYASDISWIRQLHQTGNREAAQRMFNSLPAAELGYENIDKLLAEGTSQDDYAFGDMVKRTGRDDETAALAAASKIQEASLNADDARMAFYDPDGPTKGLSVRAKAGLEEKLSAKYPGVFGASPGGAGPAIAGALGVGGGSGGGGGAFVLDAPQQAVAKTLATSGLPAPVVAGFLGNFHVEGGYGGAQGDGGQSGGIAQWKGDRRDAFIKRNGVDPTKASPEVQAAHAVWELTTPEGRKVAGISDTQYKEILAAKTPEDSATLIDKYFERSSGEARGARVAAAKSANQMLADARGAQVNIAARSMQDSAHGLDVDFMSTMGDTSDAATVADGLLAGPFKGTNRGVLMRQLTQIMDKGGINAATAGAIIRRNVHGSDKDTWGQIRRWFDPHGTPNLGNGSRLNDQGVRADIEAVSKLDQNTVQSQIRARDDRAQLSGQIEMAKQELASAQQALQQASLRAITQPGLKASLPRYQAMFEASKQKLMMLQGQSELASNKPQ